MGHQRMYPFQMTEYNYNSSSANNFDCNVQMLYYAPNPFQGLDGILFAVDEWQHRVYTSLSDRSLHLATVWYRIWRPFCNYWDNRLTGGESGYTTR